MLSASKLPLFFWAEAIATACYTQNRSIIIPTHEKTAYHIINDRKPSIKHLHIFGCTCYLTRDGENLDKMKEKGDLCILVGYSTQSKGYRVYNKRTRLIVESILLIFDEIKEMSKTSVANDTSNLELDLLFGPLYDEFFNDGTSRVNKSSSPIDNSIQKDTLHLTHIQPTSEPTTSTNVHAEENNDNQAEFTNPFCTLVQENAESSSRNIGTSNMHTFNQPQDSEYRWTKDHPLTQVHGNPSKPVQTRRQLAIDPEMHLNAFFKEEGIEHQTSTPQTPEQNGVVERRNHTLVEAARTMISASKLPLFFWAKAIATTCYTQNRSIIIPTNEKMAYHIINDRKPSIKHLHIFGCTCYLTRDGEKLDKMKEKGDPCILVGYSTQSKGYRVYNKITRLIVESIHLRFDEIKEMSETSVANDTSGLELDLLFGPLYDEFFNDGTSRVNKSSSPTDNSAPQDTHPSTNIHPTSEPTTQTNVHAEENNDNQAEFTNPFCTPDELHSGLTDYKSGELVEQTFWAKKHKGVMAQEVGIEFRNQLLLFAYWRLSGFLSFSAQVFSNFISMDVKQAFLNGPLKVEVFMLAQPDGFVDPDHPYAESLPGCLILVKAFWGNTVLCDKVVAGCHRSKTVMLCLAEVMNIVALSAKFVLQANVERMPTKIELTLEQSQQGVSNDVLNILRLPFSILNSEWKSSSGHQFKRTLRLDVTIYSLSYRVVCFETFRFNENSKHGKSNTFVVREDLHFELVENPVKEIL
ncbi:retrovirus-related pol polyprotein from transposon TNT 1-94 [Tanacetum coccineum]